MCKVIGWINKNSKKKREIKTFLQRYNHFLVKGIYRSNNTFTQWSLNVNTPQENILKEQLHVSKRSTKLYGLFAKIKKAGIRKFYSIYITGDKTIFPGETILLSRIVGKGKIISFDRKQILSFYPNPFDMLIDVQKRSLFPEEHFNLPTLFRIDIGNSFYIEQYIFKKNYTPYDAFKYVCQTALSFQTSGRCKSFNVCNLKLSFNDLEQIIGESTCRDVVGFIESNSYKRCLNHGDLYRNNIIFDGKRFYYIDYELAGNYVFFFDVLYFAMMEFYLFDNSAIVDMYFQGKLDDFFYKIFNAHGVKYIPSSKKAYFFIMCYEYFFIKYNTKIPDSLINLIR